MDDLRSSTPDERRALKAAVKRAVRMAGGAASVCHVTRVSDADLSRYAGPAHPERHCPIDVALDLCREAGAPVIVEALAHMLGFRLVPLEAKGSGGVSPADFAVISSDTARVIQGLADALADGRITVSESHKVSGEIEHEIRDLRDLQARVEANAK